MELIDHVRVDRDSPMPLQVQLTEQLRWLIVRGQITPGEKLPSVRRLADDLGINMHTARAAYRRLAVEGLVDSRVGVGTTVLDYDPRQLEAGIADIPSFTVGVIAPSLEAFYTPMLDAIEDALADEPTMLVVCNTREDPAKASWYINQLVARGVDGIIVISHNLHAPALAPGTRSDRFPPTVVVDWPSATEPAVLFDTEAGGYEATEHLIEHGHVRIGIITPPVAGNVTEIHTGIRRALGAAALTPATELVAHVPDWTTHSGAEGLSQLYSLDTPPTAILALGDHLAVGVIQSARNRGLSIPDDFALVGFGDEDLIQYLDPPLTSVHLDTAHAGTTATKMLCRLITNEPPDSTRVILPTQLILRRSCGCPTQPVQPDETPSSPN
jgi:LacI family transcriptional regulator